MILLQSIRTQELILGTLSIAGQEGRRLRLKEEEANQAKAFQNARRKRAYAEQRDDGDEDRSYSGREWSDRRGGGEQDR
jgi:hypothetical protein